MPEDYISITLYVLILEPKAASIDLDNLPKEIIVKKGETIKFDIPFTGGKPHIALHVLKIMLGYVESWTYKVIIYMENKLHLVFC